MILDQSPPFNTQQTGQRPDTQKPPEELRVGLAMCGGIALTLYEAGVSHELYRFYRAWDYYREWQHSDLSQNSPEYQARFGMPDYNDPILPINELRRSTPCGYLEAFDKTPIRPVVDILTGASAGGINSVFLASCIATGQDFGNFHDIWVDTADVTRLRFSAQDEPKGLLNTAELRRQMVEQLENNFDAHRNRQGIGATEEEPDLFVRLCRTHHKGHYLTTMDAIGHEIEVDRKADIISFRTQHFRPRSSDNAVLDAENNRSQIEELTRAALATSAFPGLFPPVHDETEGRWYIDGGLWDNQPVDLAVEAIGDKPAFARTHRCLFFVEPNPTQRSQQASLPNAAPPGEDEPSQGAVLSSLLLMGLKGNVWPAIASVLGFNQRNHIYDSLTHDPTVQEFAAKVGRQQWLMSRFQLQAAKAWFDNGVSPAGAPLFQEGGAVELTAFNEMRIQALLFDNDPALIQQWHALLARLGYRANNPAGAPPEAKRAVAAALTALKTIGLCDAEQWLLHRWLREINSDLASGRTGTVSSAEIAARKALLYERLGVISRFLYAVMVSPNNAVANNAVAGGELGAGEPGRGEPAIVDPSLSNNEFRWKGSRDRSRFRSAGETLLHDLTATFKDEKSPLIPATSRPQCFPHLERWVEEIRKTAARARRVEPCYGFQEHGTLSKSIQSAIAQQSSTGSVHGPDCESGHTVQLFMHHPDFRNCAQTQQQLLHDALNWLQQKLEEGFHALIGEAPADVHLEITQYVLSAVSDLSNKSSLDLVRISGNDTDNEHLVPDGGVGRGTAAQRKLAGERLGHVSGFLENRWRRNDYIWGRLDACEILLRTLRHYGQKSGSGHMTDGDYAACLEQCQTAILQQEAALYRRWHKRTYGEDARLQPDECGGVPACTPGTAFTTGDKAVQRANSHIIGYGGQDLVDADEPQLSDNLNYLVQQTVRLAHGSRGLIPQQLDMAARLMRVASYAVRVFTFLVPIEVHRRTAGKVWGWLGPAAIVLIVVALIAFLAGTGVSGGLISTITTVATVMVAAIFLVISGCLLGWRKAPAVFMLVLLGFSFGLVAGMQLLVLLLSRP